MKTDYRSYSDTEICKLLNEPAPIRDLAFSELYSRYSTRIHLYCRRILGNDAQADDIFQDTFIRFLRSVEKETQMTNIPAYLLRIARNLCLNAKRDERPNVPIEDFQMPYEDRSVETAEISSLVAMSLELLPEEYREALTLQAYGGLSYLEIATMLGVPVTTVRNWIVRAKKQMQEILKPYLRDEPFVINQKLKRSNND